MRAEDRFDWLDDEAAEILLRGPADDDSSSCPPPHAEELANALTRLAESHQPEQAEELPGEAEALAAFRTARSHRRGGGSRSRRGGYGGYMSRFSGTPLHVGLAMLLAGFALGGVAVAASNGVLPAPFRGDGVQGPGASGGQPPAVEPPGREDGGHGEPGHGGGTGGASREPSERAPRDGSSPTPTDRDGLHTPGHDHHDVAGADRGNGDQGGELPTDHPTTWPHESAPEDGEESSAPESWPPSIKPGTPGHSVVVALCRAYEGDRIERRKRVQLERVAGGPELVERYCEEHGDDNGGGGGTEGGDGSPGGVGIPEPPQEPAEPGSSDGGTDGGGSDGGAGGGGSDGGAGGGGLDGGAGASGSSGGGGAPGGGDGAGLDGS